MTFYRRRLPHWHPPGQAVFITWRLHGSTPKQQLPATEKLSTGESFVRYDRALDTARTGPLWLKDPRIAETLLNALQSSQQRGLFQLRAYVLMSNHVHLLIEPLSPVSEITRQIKGATARAGNLILSRTGSSFWQDESFDHWIRNPDEWKRIRAYIERNPVTAGFVSNPKDWPWSSASRHIE